MKTKKYLIATVGVLISIITLVASAQSDKVVYIFSGGKVVQKYAISEIDYIEVKDPVPAPVDIDASYNSGSTVIITWSPVENATYDLYRSSDGVEFTLLADNLTENTYIDTTPLHDIGYYRVKSVIDRIESDFSNSAFVAASVSEAVVATLCGFRNENDDQGENYGNFDVTSGFMTEGSLVFDPLYPNRLYCIQDGFGFGNKIVEIDLEKQTHTLLMSQHKFGNKRLRNASFTLDGKYMIVSQDSNDNGFETPSLWIVQRNDDGTFNDESPTAVLAAYRQCNGVAVHPVNGEVYFNSYMNGELFRLDIEKYFKHINGEVIEENTSTTVSWTGYIGDDCFEKIFHMSYPSSEYNITIHPSGDYAYINYINRNCILRTDYDWKNKRFTTPYLVAGEIGNRNWMDGFGGVARVARPYQGVFVKNPGYEGLPEEYDYYFTDSDNFSVRYITPSGMVRTFAGHIRLDDYNFWGNEDGDNLTQARFRDVTGLAYDETTETFYVLDRNNRCIRTINRVD